MTPIPHSDIWGHLNEDVATILPPEIAPIFIGCALTAPLASPLRKQFGIIPAIFIHGKAGSGKSLLASIIHHLYHPSSSQTFDFCNTSSPAQISKFLSAHPHSPPIVDPFVCRGKGQHNFLSDVLDTGRITGGTYGTISYHVSSAPAPVLVGTHLPEDPALNARYCHFRINPPQEPSPITTYLETQRQSYHLIIPALLTHGSHPHWRDLALSHSSDSEVDLAASTTMPFRRRVQLAIAFGTYSAAHQLFTGLPPAAEVYENARDHFHLLGP